MGLIAYIRDTAINNGILTALVERFKNDNASARIFNPPGVDSRPLDNDICFTHDSEDTEGGKDITGFIDPKNAPVAEKGEYRVYSRDSGGNIKASIILKTDGSIEINAPAGLKITANTDITGTLTVSKVIKGLVDIIADYAGTAITMLTHYHFGNLGRNTSPGVVTGGSALPGTPPTMDSSGQIIDGPGTKSTDHIHSQGDDSNGDTEVDTGNAQ